MNNKIIYLESNKAIRSYQDLCNFFFNKEELNQEVECASDGYKPLCEVLEGLLNKKTEREHYHLLFTNPSDFWSITLLEKLDKEYSGNLQIYVISSFELPEWFSNFKIGSKVPYLITSYGKFFVNTEYLPHIYHNLGI